MQTPLVQQSFLAPSCADFSPETLHGDTDKAMKLVYKIVNEEENLPTRLPIRVLRKRVADMTAPADKFKDDLLLE